jgi:hypothetical protein
LAIFTQLNFLYSQHEHAITARIAGFEDAITSIANNLVDHLIDLEGFSGPGPWLERRQLVFLQSQMRGQLNKMGYPDVCSKLISHYDESAVFAHSTLPLLGHPSQHLIPLRSDTLQQLKDLDLSAFEEIGNNAIRVLARQVTMNALIGTKRSEVIMCRFSVKWSGGALR